MDKLLKPALTMGVHGLNDGGEGLRLFTDWMRLWWIALPRVGTVATTGAIRNTASCQNGSGCETEAYLERVK